jgi:N-acetylmuramoyl-L-alanine amidase
MLSVITDKQQNHCIKSLLPHLLPIFILLFAVTWGREALGQASAKKFTVTIDAGHGGKDTGAPGKKSVEKNIALGIALKLGHYMETQMEDVAVFYTRKTDIFIPLYERAQIANRNKSDLFVSIHVNANKKPGPTGTATYVMGFSRSKENLDLVMEENKAMLLEQDYKIKYANFDPTDPQSYILFNNVQNNNLTQSLELASAVQDQFREQARRKDIGVHQGNLVVLWGCAKPSVLVETGFISNPEEEAFLITESGQDILAAAIYTAIRNYKESIDSRAGDVAKAVASNPEADRKEAEMVKKTEDPVKRIEEADSKVVESGNQDSRELAKTSDSQVITEPGPGEPMGVEFRVQVLASVKKLPPNSPEFKGVKGFDELKIEGYYKYMTQSVKSYPEALAIKRKMGASFNGAFVVAFKDGKKVPLGSVVDLKKKY